MSTTSLWRWEQDASGGEHGTATYFPGMSHEITMPMPSFMMAHKLYMCVEASVNHARWDGRKNLLNEISRIEP